MSRANAPQLPTGEEIRKKAIKTTFLGSPGAGLYFAVRIISVVSTGLAAYSAVRESDVASGFGAAFLGIAIVFDCASFWVSHSELVRKRAEYNSNATPPACSDFWASSGTIAAFAMGGLGYYGVFAKKWHDAAVILTVLAPFISSFTTGGIAKDRLEKEIALLEAYTTFKPAKKGAAAATAGQIQVEGADGYNALPSEDRTQDSGSRKRTNS